MTQKVGRNDPCPCGSGKKYKVCCIHKNKPATRRKLKATVLNTKPHADQPAAETAGPDLIARTFTQPASQQADDPFEQKP